MLKRKHTAGLMLSVIQAITGNFLPQNERFSFSEKNKDDYQDNLIVGLSDEEAAYMACKMCPIASKLSSQRRRLWQIQLVEDMK